MEQPVHEAVPGHATPVREGLQLRRAGGAEQLGGLGLHPVQQAEHSGWCTHPQRAAVLHAGAHEGLVDGGEGGRGQHGAGAAEQG